MIDTRRFLNIGSGMFSDPKWVNIDFDTDWYKRIHHGRKIDINHDLMSFNTIPLPSESYELIYSSHTIEHLTDPYVKRMIQESYRLLEPDGLLRITCPDIRKCYDAYWRASNADREYIAQWKGNSTSPFRQHDFGNQFLFIFAAYCSSYFSGPRKLVVNEDEIRELANNSAHREDFLSYFTDICARHSVELQSKYAGDHISWWDADKLCRIMVDVGFRKENITTTLARSSKHPACNRPDFDTQKPSYSLYIEAVKA
jgi:predicted SAM-dependent methyltransferase